MKFETKEEYFKSYTKWMEYYQKQIVKPDYSEIEYLEHFARVIDAVENRPIYIFDLYTMDFFYISERYLSLLGYSAGKKVDSEFFYEAVHPDDYLINMESPVKFHELVCTLPIEEKYDYKMVSDYRLRMPTGEYVRVIDQIILLNTDSKGYPWLCFSTCDLSPSQDLEKPPGSKIVKVSTGETVMKFGDTSLLNLSSILTKREYEVLTLVSKGYLSKQIAEKLEISINTINNHRKNILVKTGCSNTFEAIKLIANNY